MHENKANALLDKSALKAAAILEDEEQMSALLEEVAAIVAAKSPVDALAYLPLLYEYAAKSHSHEYEPEDKAYLDAVGALLYRVAPLDAVPDFLPGGETDDAAVVLACVKRHWDELEKFKSLK